jgi:hypothetical protein
MGCYLEDNGARVGTWKARTSWATRTTWRISQRNGRVMSCLGTIILCATTLAVLLVIGRGGGKSWTWCGGRKNFGSFV